MNLKQPSFLFLELKHLCTRKPYLSKPSKSILDLVDYERAPSVSMDTKKEYFSLIEVLTKQR
jgi:hypothetical protein